MFWAFKFSFVVYILAFFDLATLGLFFEKFGNFLFWSSGHPAWLGQTDKLAYINSTVHSFYYLNNRVVTER